MNFKGRADYRSSRRASVEPPSHVQAVNTSAIKELVSNRLFSLDGRGSCPQDTICLCTRCTECPFSASQEL